MRHQRRSALVSPRAATPVDGSTFGHIPPNVRVSRASALPPRLTVSPDEASKILGVSRGFFLEHIQGELRTIYVGRRRLIPVRELERWVEASTVMAGAGK
jgi:excisionase family DNA binding protein